MILVYFDAKQAGAGTQAVFEEIDRFPHGSPERHEAMGMLFTVLARKEWQAAERLRRAPRRKR